MPNHVYHKIYLHLIWHTKESYPLLTAVLAPKVYQILERRCHDQPTIRLHAVGGTETHVHLAVSISPACNIGELVRELKGGSSHDINRIEGRVALAWQRGYGVVSYAERDLPGIVRYVQRQQKHHAAGTTRTPLESIRAEEGDG